MKERLLKKGVTLLLVAVIVAAGVFASLPGVSQAAAGTTYTVVLQKGSPILSLVSVNSSAAAPQLAQQEGITFKMVVDAKAKTEKLKSTGGTATYYPVTIIGKSYKAPTQKFPMVGGGGMAIQSSVMAKDAKGKLYTSGGDVDISVVVGKKAVEKVGDGKVDPAGSMIFPGLTITSIITLESTGKVIMTTPSIQTMTTGQASLVVSGSKTRLDGKKLPADDTTKALSNPLVGTPVDLNAGTGILVSTNGSIGNKSKQIGTTDFIGGQIWNMKISK
jgi:hypothetical protein